MTPSELYEVVKDVPRIAWPLSDNREWRLVYREEEGLRPAAFWWRAEGGKFDGTWSNSEMNPALLFEASMTRWLENEYDVHTSIATHTDGLFRIYTGIGVCSGKGPTKLHALAAACKAVGGGRSSPS